MKSLFICRVLLSEPLLLIVIFFSDRLVDIVNDTGKGYTVWQEIIDRHVKVKDDTVVEVWKVRILNSFTTVLLRL